MDCGGSKSSKRFVYASETEQSIDRLSDLPETMLCHILSFLTIKESVATSILARRWRYLWTNFSTLEFNSRMCENLLDDEFDHILLKCNIRHGNSHGRFDIAYARNRGSDIVNRLLLMQNVQVLNTFNLRYKLLDFTDSQIDSWITIAIARGVENIEIEIIGCSLNPLTDACSNKLPVSLFRCETLVDLRLHECFVYIRPKGKVSMSSLKKLVLKYMTYGDDETIPRLLSGCPVLEKLVIEQEKFEWLVVKYLPTLIEANIILRKDDTYACSWPVDILNGFSNAKSLVLSYLHGEFSDSKFEALTSKFTNLIKFDYMCSDCRLLVKFLEKADNLKHLHVQQVKSRHWQDPPQVFGCLLSHLETVFVHVCHDDHTYSLVRYLVKNAKVLKNMTVGIPFELPTIDREILEDKISSLERGSPECRIVFDEY